MSSPKVFVCGATGNQGGALIPNILDHHIEVHAISRDLESASAKSLLARGVSLAEGDYDNEVSLEKSMTGCTTLFLNLNFNYTKPQEELEQAQRILYLAKRLGIQQVIYTSAMATTDPTRLTYWDPNSLVAMWVILRPGNFMTNFLNPVVRMYQGLVETNTFTTAFARDTILPMVDPDDIGKFAAAAILDPARFNQKEIEIASQMMGVEDVMRDLSEATGRNIKANFMSEEEIKINAAQDPMVRAQLAMRDLSLFVEMEKIKSWGIELGSFANFLTREKARVDATYLETSLTS
ncbi:uncharacterized protein N7477_009435 [Penicillium maclennaniae]|uniref:uncharacterized protein n=1 Tax=Penicillium maclennaniae TaxID=1343394 RepID=UPI002541F0FB|nr:uncharacterized protein N7477_009435 [Penicillium maclennaniae]KAJ5661819.1 hypothetical protein N7477_009435 [Penicillium maclennaniae]